MENRSESRMKNIFMRVLSGERFYSVWIPYPGLRCGFEAEEYISILLGSRALPLPWPGGELMQLDSGRSTACIILFRSFVIVLAFHPPRLTVRQFIQKRSGIAGFRPEIPFLLSYPFPGQMSTGAYYIFWQINTCQKFYNFFVF